MLTYSVLAKKPEIILKEESCFPETCSHPVITGDATCKKLLAHRIRALGNSVVPLAARLAFFRLYTGYKIETTDDIHKSTAVQYGDFMSIRTFGRSDVPCRHGMSVVFGDKIDYRNISVKSKKRRHISIWLDPGNYTPAVNWVKKVQMSESTPIYQITERSGWPTPRVSAAQHSHVLTCRTMCDLSTFALFVTHIDGVQQRKTKVGDSMDARFVEWIMGYPENWTKVS